MPYKDLEVRRAYDRMWKRDRRVRQKALNAGTKPLNLPDIPEDPVRQAGLIAEWSSDCLLIPAGHPLAGQPLKLEPFQVEFLQGALTCKESLLCLARKNGKSALIAVLMLSYVAEGAPLLSAGWRGGIVSLSKVHARELMMLCMKLIESSKLDGLTVRTPPPLSWGNPEPAC